MTRHWVLGALPVLAALAWIGAFAVSIIRLNPWGPFGDGWSLYGWAAPAWMMVVLAGLSLASLVMAFVRPHIALNYLPAAFLLPLGTGGRLILGDQMFSMVLLEALLFAAFIFLLVEWTGAKPRFQAIVESTGDVDDDEAAPVQRYLLRYFGLGVLMVALYAGILALFIGILIPAVSGIFSTRLQDGLEVRSSIGITALFLILISLPVAVRMIMDAFRNDDTSKEADA